MIFKNIYLIFDTAVNVNGKYIYELLYFTICTIHSKCKMRLNQISRPTFTEETF